MKPGDLNTQETLDKIEAIKAVLIYGRASEKDIELAGRFREDFTRAVLTAQLLEHDAVKMLVKKYKDELADIMMVLSEDATLAETGEKAAIERKTLFEKKRWIRELLDYFEGARPAAEAIAEEVDRNEKHLGKFKKTSKKKPK